MELDPFEIQDLYETAFADFKDTLYSLRHVLFHVAVKQGARRKLNERDEVYYDLSFPINSRYGSFDLVTMNPPDIENNLASIPVDYDPRVMLGMWREMEKALKAKGSNP